MRRENTTTISPTPEIVAELRAGHMVILVDEEDRENEGDLVIAAEHITPEAINFMAKHARGLVCLTLTEERRRQLEPAADGAQQPLADGNQLHRLDRGSGRRDDRHLGA